LHVSPWQLDVAHSGGMAIYVNSVRDSFSKLGFTLVSDADLADVWHELDGFNVRPVFFQYTRKGLVKVITIHDLQECVYPERFENEEIEKRVAVYKGLESDPNIIIVAISEFTKTQIRKYYPNLKNKVVVVPHGISHVQSFNTIWGASRSTPIPEGSFGLVLAKGWSHKNLDEFVAAVIKQLDYLRQQKIGFIIIGDANLSEESADLISDNAAQDVLSFTGFVDDERRDKIMAAAAVVISASDYEGFGLVAYEAKKYGKKYVGFNLPVLTEIFTDEEVRKIAIGDFDDLVATASKEIVNFRLVSPTNRRWDDVAVDLIYTYWQGELPKVSVVTASYNREKYLDRCLTSLYQQNYENFEHVVVDGLSSDNSVSLFSKYGDSRLSLTSERDKGIYDAFNKGALRAQGELIAFLNTDDWYEPNFLRKSVAIHLSGNYSFTFGDIWFHNKSGVVTSIPGNHAYDRRPETNFVDFHHTTVLARRELFEEIGLFPRFIKYPIKRELRITADYLWFLEVIKRGHRGIRIPHLVGHMELGGISTTQHEQAAIEGWCSAVNAHPLKLFTISYHWGKRLFRLKYLPTYSRRNFKYQIAAALRNKYPLLYRGLRYVVRTYRKINR